MGESGFLQWENFVRHRFFGSEIPGENAIRTSVEPSQVSWVLGLNIVVGRYQEMVITLIDVSIRCASNQALFRTICWSQTVAVVHLTDLGWGRWRSRSRWVSSLRIWNLESDLDSQTNFNKNQLCDLAIVLPTLHLCVLIRKRMISCFLNRIKVMIK